VTQISLNAAGKTAEV